MSDMLHRFGEFIVLVTNARPGVEFRTADVATRSKISKRTAQRWLGEAEALYLVQRNGLNKTSAYRRL